MNNLAKSKSKGLRIEGKAKKLTWNQLTKAANQIAKKKSGFTPSPSEINSRVENKIDPSKTYYQKNIKWRNVAKGTSWLCFILSLGGALFGVGTFIQPSNPTSWLLSIICGLIVIAIEIGFRYFSDKYFDLLFLLRKKVNHFLPKFLILSFVSISISSGGIYKWNLEHHAPDPALLAIKAEIKEKKTALILEQKAYDQLVHQSTVKDGKDKGRIQYKLEDSVNAAKENLEALKTTVAKMETKVRGKKVLDKNYQDKVFKDSLLFAFIFALFACLYIFCMRYMSYFDNRHYMESNPVKYLAYLRENNYTENENF